MSEKIVKKKVITQEQKIKAETQLKGLQRSIDYDTKDYTVELIVDKFNKDEFFVPEYQRAFIWKPENWSSFVESVLLGLPIPFMFFGDCEDGRMEIIDGVQRINTLKAFIENEIVLKGLPKLTGLNGFTFEDLSEAQQRRFKNRSLRIVMLDSKTSDELRQEIFNRVNRSGMTANDSEVRRGSYPGPLTNFLDTCANGASFKDLCPVNEYQEKRHERFELVLRFFAYLNHYEEFGHNVAPFLDGFLISNQKTFAKKDYFAEFTRMCSFVKKHFPFGFAKTKNAKTTPRVRFEAISVGAALALRMNPNLRVSSVNWLESENFKNITTSDASNNQGKLRKRVEFVRDELLKGAVDE